MEVVNNLYFNILAIAELRNESLYEFCANCGIDRSSISRLGSNESTSLSRVNLEKVALYTGFLPDELHYADRAVIEANFHARKDLKYKNIVDLFKSVF